jgi:hypothetical protein
LQRSAATAVQSGIRLTMLQGSSAHCTSAGAASPPSPSLTEPSPEGWAPSAEVSRFGEDQARSRRGRL